MAAVVNIIAFRAVLVLVRPLEQMHPARKAVILVVAVKDMHLQAHKGAKVDLAAAVAVDILGKMDQLMVVMEGMVVAVVVPEEITLIETPEPEAVQLC